MSILLWTDLAVSCDGACYYMPCVEEEVPLSPCGSRCAASWADKNKVEVCPVVSDLLRIPDVKVAPGGETGERHSASLLEDFNQNGATRSSAKKLVRKLRGLRQVLLKVGRMETFEAALHGRVTRQARTA